MVYRMMKKLFLLLSFASLFAACNTDIDEPNLPESDKSDITIIAYLLADTSLIPEDLWTNIAAIYDGLTLMTKQASVLIYWDGASQYSLWDYPVVLKYSTDGRGNVNGQPKLSEDATVEDVVELAEVVKEYSQHLSTDKKVMTDVLNDLINMTDTKRLGLIAGSHGSAWLNKINFSRSFGEDGGAGSGNTITIKDMADVIRTTGRHFEFLLFDACNMATIEVYYDFKDIVDYMIGSVLEVPAIGFPYETSLHYLYDGTIDGYKKVCDEFVKFYDSDVTDGGVSQWGTVSLVDNKQMGAMADLVKREIMEHKELLATYTPYNLQEYGRGSKKYVSCDMEQFLKDINGGTLSIDLKSQLEKTILYKNYVDDCKYNTYAIKGENYCGLGLYIPLESRRAWNETFKTIDWYTAAGWNEVTFCWDF